VHKFGSLKLQLPPNIERTKLLDEPRRHILLKRLTDMPDGDRLCHGDFPPDQRVGPSLGPRGDRLAWRVQGEPGADVCRSYLLLKLHAEENC
jgi:hypothetical protein